MLFIGVKLAKCAIVARGYEHRIIAKPFVTARRPYERTEHLAFKAFGLPIVGPSNRQSAGEMSVMARFIARCLNFSPYPLHRAAEVAIAFIVFGPAGRKDSWQSVQRVD